MRIASLFSWKIHPKALKIHRQKFTPRPKIHTRAYMARVKNSRAGVYGRGRRARVHGVGAMIYRACVWCAIPYNKHKKRKIFAKVLHE